jgi:Protein of unknown function (DUF3300)
VLRLPLPILPVLLLCAVAASSTAFAQDGGTANVRPEKPASGILKPEQLEPLLAPIALYPDPLLAQVLMASTYPLEVVQAARWSKANPKVSGKDLEQAMLKQSWDASVKSLCSFPDTLAMMNEHLEWTQDLGDAFLAQQDDVMEAVQALRAKAVAAGNLKSSKELTVTSEKPAPPPADAGIAIDPAAQPQQIIVIQPANPQVVYVPTYNPVVVYGTWPYPAYPPYPVYPPGYVATTAVISFGVGLAVGAAMWGGCHWGYRGYSSVNININNYNRYNHTNISNNNNWNHNANHRQGVPYADQRSQDRYGGGRGNSANASTRDAYRGRDQGSGGGRGSAASPSQRPAGGGSSGSTRPAGGGPSANTRPAGGSPSASTRPAGGGPSASTRPAGGGPSASTRPAGGSAAQRPSAGGTASNRGGGSAYQGMNSGGQARAASSRGHSSMRGGGGGGGRRR